MARRELFVWYRVPAERAGDARRVVAAFQAALCAQWPGLQARILVRDDGVVATWMETYARAPSDPSGAGVDAAIEAAIAAAAQPLAALIDGGRHVEAFTALA